MNNIFNHMYLLSNLMNQLNNHNYYKREEAFNPSPKPGLEERISAPLPTAGGAITCINQEVSFEEKNTHKKQLKKNHCGCHFSEYQNFWVYSCLEHNIQPDQGNLGEKSSRSPDKQLPRPDSSPDLAHHHRANGNPPSKAPNSSSSLSNGKNIILVTLKFRLNFISTQVTSSI